MAVKLKVDGYTDLKKQINDAKNAMKALNAELNASQAAFEATGDSQKYVEDQTRLLNEQIEEQQKILDSSQEAMEKLQKAGYEGSSAYTQMRASAANAQASIYTLQTRLKGVATTGTEAKNGAQRAAEGIKEVGAQAGTASTETGDLSTKLGGIAAQIGFDGVIRGIDSIRREAIRAARAVVQIGKDLWQSGEDAAAWADDLMTNARNAGVDIKTYQQWEYAAELVDVSIDDMIKAQDRLAKKRESGAKTFSIFDLGEDIDQLGRFASGLTEAEARINYYDASGNLKSYNDLLWETVEVLGKVKDENVQNTIAQGMFGKSYREVKGLFEEGARENWNKYMDEAFVVDEEGVKRLGSYKDALEGLEQSFDAVKMSVLAGFAPAFTEIAEAFTKVFSTVQKWAESDEGRQAIENFGSALGSIVTDFTNGDLTEALNNATEFVNGLSDKFKELQEIDLGKWAAGIGIALGGLTAAEGVAKIMKFVADWKAVFGAGATASMSATVTTVADTATAAGIASIGSTLSSIFSILGPLALAVAAIKVGYDLANPEHQQERADQAATMFEGTAIEEFAKDLQASDSEIAQAIGKGVETSLNNFERTAAHDLLKYQQLMTGTTGAAGIGASKIPQTEYFYFDASTGEYRAAAKPIIPAKEKRTSEAEEYGKAWAEAAQAIVEETWDAYRAGTVNDDWDAFDTAWENMENVFAGMPEQLQFVSDVMDDMIRVWQMGNPLAEDFGQESWFARQGDEAYSALNEMGVAGMQEVASGLESAIPDVAATVAHLNNVISQIGRVSIGVPTAGNTTNNNSSVYIENYNAAVRGNGIGAWNEQNFREISAYGG